MSRPGDIRAGLVVVFVLLCMWVDLLLSVPTWLRSAAQVAFIVVLVLGVLLAVAHDIRILVTSSPRNVPPRPAEPGVASGGGTP